MPPSPAPAPRTSGSVPFSPWFLASMTSHVRSAPGSTRMRSVDSFARLACSGEAYVTKAHWRPGSQPVFKKTSTTWPYLSNSDLRTVSEMLSGREPTKIFLGPVLTGATADDDNGATGSWPNWPWFRASVTSHARLEPGITRMRSVLTLASWASWCVEKVTKAHWRPGSQPCFTKVSTTWPYLENSVLNCESWMPSGSEPTKIFFGPSPACGCEDRDSRLCCPNMPWFFATITSQGRSMPGNVRIRSQLSFANWACSGVAKVTKAHCRPGSQPCLTKTSSIWPYCWKVALRVMSEIPFGKDPTKTFRDIADV
mmetsp:Transcript_81551/g.225875  ORF Transcript_81551/g.225875 Transcript_81551/m.225875 type:complete len:312 (-) Transcript_81551:87-1022(-)